MTGLVFTGGKAPAKKKILSIINNLQDNYVIAAADSGLDTAEKAGIKPDWIIGDMDSLSNPDRLKAYSKKQIIKYPKDKNFTDTELAFSLLKEKGCKDIWIIGGAGGRIDHLFAIRSMLEREFIPTRWILDNADIFCIDAANNTKNRDELTLYADKNTIISIFPLGCGPWKASSKGLKWNLNYLKWDKGFFSLSNITQNKKNTIKAEKGRFMIVVLRD